MVAIKFDQLPSGLLLEICGYLDVEELFAISQSLWLHALLHRELVLPLASHKPLIDFTAAELKAAALFSIRKEKNLMGEKISLLSTTHIHWPYPRLNSRLDESDPDVHSESPEDTIWMHLCHPNGDWVFTVSKMNVLRVIHLGTGVVALEERHDIIPVTLGASIPYIAFAVDFMGDQESMLAMVVSAQKDPSSTSGPDSGDSSTQINAPMLRIFRVILDASADLPVVTLEEQAQHRLPVTPAHLDIAGHHVAYVESTDDDNWYGESSVRLFNWKRGQFIDLPPLLPSVQVSTFQEYFFSLGISPANEIVLQVVAFPPRDSYAALSSSIRSSPAFNGDDADEKVSSYPLVASIVLPTPIGQTLEPTHAAICHYYTGQNPNHIRIWIRDHYVGEWSACWSVFSIPVDFSKTVSHWFREEPFEPRYSVYQNHLRKFGIRHQQVFEKVNLSHWAVPVAPGRRFIWWSHTQSTPPPSPPPPSSPALIETPDSASPGDGGTSAAPGSDSSQIPDSPEASHPTRLFFFTNVIDHLPLVDEEEYKHPDFDIVQYSDQAAVRYEELELEAELYDVPSSVYSVDMEESSGTVIIMRTSGHIDVLRYSGGSPSMDALKPTNGFSKLPTELILETIAYLDAQSVVSLSQTSSLFRTLSTTSRMFWIPSILHSELVMPFPAHQSLYVCDPFKLHLAAHHAVLRDKNILSQKPALMSHKRITWPFEVTVPETVDSAEAYGYRLRPESPLDEINSYYIHPSGTWMFLLSTENIFRILHLESGRIVWATAECRHPPGFVSTIARNIEVFAMDFVTETRAILALVLVALRITIATGDAVWCRKFKVMQLDLDPIAMSAQSIYRAEHSLSFEVETIEIYGNYVFILERSNAWDSDGHAVPHKLHMIDWRDGRSIPLPPSLLPSKKICAYPAYLISVGITPERTKKLQVLQYLSIPDDFRVGSNETSLQLEGKSDYLPCLVTDVDFPVTPMRDAISEVKLCHYYTGSPKGIVRVFVRNLGLTEDSGWSSSSFTFMVDLFWRSSIEHTPATRCEVTHRLIWECAGLTNFYEVFGAGKYLFWWKFDPDSKDTENRHPIRLFTAVVDDIEPSIYTGGASKDFQIVKVDYPSREMESPITLGGNENATFPRVYVASGDIQSSSASGLVTMTCGDVWVLRFGRAFSVWDGVL
ncbi:hypothetical protein FRC17_002286 [Serendipita sp. 399]|nr:hypothetical protein FRC17_002286 [Serendipita sp. 399]